MSANQISLSLLLQLSLPFIQSQSWVAFFLLGTSLTLSHNKYIGASQNLDQDNMSPAQGLSRAVIPDRHSAYPCSPPLAPSCLNSF